MGKHVTHFHRGDCLDPTAAALPNEPPAFIHKDHLREREICACLDQMAQGGNVASGCAG
jgi:hypothetical protein